MSVTQALEKAFALLRACRIDMADAPAAGEALNLIAASIDALKSAPAQEEESK